MALKVKAVFFDFMGTCLDWHRSAVDASPASLSKEDASKLVLQWRQQYFNENSYRLQQNLTPEDIDITLARALDIVLDKFDHYKPHFGVDEKKRMVQEWHSQQAWPEVPKAIQSIQEDLGLETFVHANGTTRLQLNLTRSSGLKFNMLFSSQILGVYKPNPEAYTKALELVQLRPCEVVLVAAHAYDLRGAKNCGMKTIYIHRWTDDIEEDMEQVRGEFDVFLEDMESLPAAIANL
ncbi:unnamed protein product [Clonostachys chloroleuca]|uniref:Haloacid dehalogenase, type II n=1 Tax=Clonostachys chloroleuca TaxID=1926264 RepID=A0AA35LVB9_9HYPO|nr:unnamed protein product [Clonostachys chloroleuca]